jgi:hypothetical protein
MSRGHEKTGGRGRAAPPRSFTAVDIPPPGHPLGGARTKRADTWCLVPHLLIGGQPGVEPRLQPVQDQPLNGPLTSIIDLLAGDERRVVDERQRLAEVAPARPGVVEDQGDVGQRERQVGEEARGAERPGRGASRCRGRPTGRRRRPGRATRSRPATAPPPARSAAARRRAPGPAPPRPKATSPSEPLPRRVAGRRPAERFSCHRREKPRIPARGFDSPRRAIYVSGDDGSADACGEPSRKSPAAAM